MVRAVSLSHQVMGSKQPLHRFCGGKACLGISLPQSPLMWEPLALGLPFFVFFGCIKLNSSRDSVDCLSRYFQTITLYTA